MAANPKRHHAAPPTLSLPSSPSSTSHPAAAAMKRTRAQNPKLQDPQDPSAAANPAPTPKPQRKAKQPKAAAGAGGKKASAAAAAREAAAAGAAAAAASSLVSVKVEMAPVVPDVCDTGGGGAAEVAGDLPADWDEMDGGLGSNISPWWTFGVEEEKLLGWFPFVEEDFGGCQAGAGVREPEPAAFDDDIWRIHQIYEIPSYAAK